MAAKKLDPEQALIKALGHPQRKELLKLCLEAEEPTSPKELALETHRGKRSFYRPTELARGTPWVLAALGLGDRA